MRLLRALALAALPALAGTPLLAQGRGCTIVEAEDLNNIVTERGRMTLVKGPAQFDCDGGVTVRADNATVVEWAGEIQLSGNVFYGDTAKTVTAEWLNYFGREGRLFARGNVVLTDRKTGSTARGPVLEHYDAGPGQPVPRTVLRNKPHATIRRLAEPAGGSRPPARDTVPAPADTAAAEAAGGTPDSAAAPGEASAAPAAGGTPDSVTAPGEASADPAQAPVPADSAAPTAGATDGPPARPAAVPADTAPRPPLEVDSEWMEFVGDSAFHAYGAVRFSQGGTRGGSTTASYDQAADRLLLAGEARIQTDSVFLAGDTVEVALEGESFREVEARREARLEARDLSVEAPLVRVFFQEGEVERLVALGRTAGDEEGAEGEDALQARARAPEFLLVADSIDARAPARVLEEVTAVGNAYAEGAQDSLAADLPEPIARNWLRGDTVIAYFGADTAASGAGGAGKAAAAAPEGGDRPERVLERVVAVGQNPGARSVFRMREERSGDPPTVDYVVAERITLELVAGEVVAMELIGQVRGIRLQPSRKPAGESAEPGKRTAAGGEP